MNKRSNPDNLLEQLDSLRKPLAGDVPVAELIDPLVKPAALVSDLGENRVQCFACAHRCKINPGGRGICQVRYNLDGTLYAPWGYVAALQSDPTEKKPFYHMYPGSDTLTFGMLGCDLHCSYCQNWDISQALRDANAGRPVGEITPETMLEMAMNHKVKCVASSYNEPLITSEWAVAIFELTHAAGFTNLYVSNGNATREVLEYIRPFTTGFKVDLKTMNDKNYRHLGTVRDHVLDGIRLAHTMGFWVEIVTLMVPGFNDSEVELREAAQFIKSVSPDIPWHISAFHKNYKMYSADNTKVDSLIRAVELGYEEGLNYVYAGNLAGRVGNFENTFCPKCKKELIARFAYIILDYQISSEGKCPNCGTSIAGYWPESRDEVRLGNAGDTFFRRPRSVT